MFRAWTEEVWVGKAMQVITRQINQGSTRNRFTAKSMVGLSVVLLSVLLVGGCNFFGGSEELQDEEVSSVDTPADSEGPEADAGEDGATVDAGQSEDGELFKEAMLPGLPSAAQVARAELLPSTDADERVREIERDRPDPYAYVPIPPAPRPAPPAPASSPSGNAGGGGRQPTPGGRPTVQPLAPPGSTAQAGGGTQGGGTTNASAGNGGGQPNTSGTGTALAPLPILPEPTVVASQVQVSGIASVSGEKYAIVKAPGEPTSRYVRPGDRLSNGAVLVKRIENRPGTQPFLVLEERGEEVTLTVGANATSDEEPTAAAASATPAIASLPYLN